jgi:cytidine deaminase
MSYWKHYTNNKKYGGIRQVDMEQHDKYKMTTEFIESVTKKSKKIYNSSELIKLFDTKDYSNEIKYIYEKIYKSRWNDTHHYAMFFGIKKWRSKSSSKSTVGVNHVIENKMSIHAEMDAINKLNRFVNNNRKVKEKFNLLVIRLTKTGVIGESRPCYHCLVRLQRYCNNIGYIYYSTSTGKIVRERLENMLQTKIHISLGNRIRIIDSWR